ncbi:MAG: efflux RND transporter periplasmic adaptor subunit [Acidobacteriaceae bacterium]
MKKIILIVVCLAVAVGGIIYATIHRDSGLAAVQAGKVTRRDLVTIVSASGQIKPKDYVNIGANAFGKITNLYVKEGDHVKKGQLLARLENVQPTMDLASTRSQLESSRYDDAAAQATYNQAVLDLDRAKADFQQKQLDYQRGKELFNQQLIAKSDYDTRVAAFEMSKSQLAQAQSKILQAKAQSESAKGHIAQYGAQLRHAADVLSKTDYPAPYDGVITNVPVREGETVVVGIQNSPGSTLMTLSDMSVVTAEVKVDETDIVNVRVGQAAEVTIDAMPNRVFPGHVTEIGDNAILRSSGVSSSQSTTGDQEAKDFKVVVTLDNPPDNLRPGLSTTAKITTARKNDATAVPIQALVSRKPEELKITPVGGPHPKLQPASASTASASPVASQNQDPAHDITGVFVLTGSGDKKTAEFREVKTGVYGSTDVEIVSGLKEGDQVVTGPYRVLRNLKNQTRVKIEKPAANTEQKS